MNGQTVRERHCHRHCQLSVRATATASRPPPLLTSLLLVLAANTVPTGALRMIHSGKFLPDDKTLKGEQRE